MKKSKVNLQRYKWLFVLVPVVLVLIVALSFVLGMNNRQASVENASTYETKIDNLYNDLRDKNAELSEKQRLINELQVLKTQNLSTIGELESTIHGLRDTVNLNNTNITNLTSQKLGLENNILALNSEIATNETTISSLQNQVETLQLQVAVLTESNADKVDLIDSLNVQISSYQSQITNLQNTNISCFTTIELLNNQIIVLNEQISGLSLQAQASANLISGLQSQVTQLQNSISYYEQYIAGTVAEDKVVATFEFNGSVYGVQVVNKNSTVNIVSPTSTDYIVFNGWTVNGVAVDLNTYQVSSNTKFVANVTNKYAVNFVVDGLTVNSQIITNGSYAVVPTAPTKSGYVFDGWTLNNNLVDVATTQIVADTNFIAKFTKVFTVTFAYENDVVSTQTVRNGDYASNVAVSDTTYKIFNGWKLNNVFVNVPSYSITANTTFVADITYKHDVQFVVDNLTVNSQIITNGSYAVVPTAPTKSGYIFNGWLLDNEIVDISTTPITTTTIFVADFARLEYWSSITVSGVSDFNAVNLWTDGENIYYVSGTEQYVLDAETYTFSPIGTSGLSYSVVFDASKVWTDGIDTYYDTKYIFNKNSLRWSSCNISFSESIIKFSCDYLWSDGTDIYCSCRTGFSLSNFKFDRVTKIFSKVYISNIPSNLSAACVWTDGENVYCSSGINQYVLDKTTYTWATKTWYGLTNFNGACIWRDGENTYYSNGTEQYVLDKTTSTWSVKTWDGLTDFSGFCVYVVSDTMYYLDASNNFYVFVK